MDADNYSNPVPPQIFNPIEGDLRNENSQKLTNADFRRLMMTPRPGLAIGDMSTHNPLGPAPKSKPRRKTKKEEDDENKKKKEKNVSKRRRSKQR